MEIFFGKRVIIVTFVVAVCVIGAVIFWIVQRDTVLEPETSFIAITDHEAAEVIGTSVEGREIKSYVYGSGDTHLAFIGGIHGGYEWNSVLVAYELMDYISANPDTIPENLTIHVIPSANPDGVYKVIGKEERFALNDVPRGAKEPGRFNAHEVDLNRNFDCKWKPTGTWRGTSVGAGSAPFSEPEAKAIRDFVLEVWQCVFRDVNTRMLALAGGAR